MDDAVTCPLADLSSVRTEQASMYEQARIAGSGIDRLCIHFLYMRTAVVDLHTKYRHHTTFRPQPCLLPRFSPDPLPSRLDKAQMASVIDQSFFRRLGEGVVYPRSRCGVCRGVQESVSPALECPNGQNAPNPSSSFDFVPLLSPLTISNYSGSCLHTKPLFESGLNVAWFSPLASGSSWRLTRTFSSFAP
jgi:hypothetical protein